MRFVVISGTRWTSALVVASDEQERALEASCITVEEDCDSLDLANARAVEIAQKRGWA